MDLKKSQKLWSSFWEGITPEVKSATSSAVKGIESVSIPTVKLSSSTTSRQVPLSKTKSLSPEKSTILPLSKPPLIKPKKSGIGKPPIEIMPEMGKEIKEIFETATKRIISDEMYQNAQERIKEKLKGLKAGIDPTILPHMVTVGAYHIESGIRTFTDWSKVMVKSYGEKIKPYLRDIWKQANSYLNQRIPEKAVKGQVREVTGQIKDQELSDLGFAFIKAARAAREAYRAGNKEGVARERQRMADILTRAKMRMDELGGIKRDIKTLKKIQEKAVGKIALDYQEKIRELLKDIDLSKPTEETIERLKGLADFISREGIPLGISQAELNRLERLQKTPFRELSKEAREDIVETAQKLFDLGKLKRKLQLNEESREQAQALDKLIGSTINLDPILSGEEKPTKMDNFKTGLKKTSMDILHTFRQADIADGSKDYQGENARMIKEQMFKETEVKNMTNDIVENLLKEFKKLGIEEIDYESDMAKKINVVLYSEQGARGQTKALMGKYGMKEIPALNKAERSIVNLLRGEFDKIVGDTIKVYEKRENLKFEKVKNYFPIRYKGEVYITPFESIDQNRNRYRT